MRGGVRLAAPLLCLALGAATAGCTSTTYDCGELGEVRVKGFGECFVEGLVDCLFDSIFGDDDGKGGDSDTTSDAGSNGMRRRVRVPGQRTSP